VLKKINWGGNVGEIIIGELDYFGDLWKTLVKLDVLGWEKEYYHSII
jgi:hypothetical protein